MSEEKIKYFEKVSLENTTATIKLIKEKALELKPEAVIITSTSGRTGLEAAKAFDGSDIKLIIVPFQKHIAEKHNWLLDADLEKKCLELGAVFLPDEPKCKLLDDERNDLIWGWYAMGQGVKVALQVATMCVDTGLIAEGATVISSGGSDNGADSAILMKAYGYENAKKNRINKIITMISQ
jgi:hypothetical protein